MSSEQVTATTHRIEPLPRESPPAAESRNRGVAATAWPIGAIILLGAALRFSQIDQSLYADELWSWVGATSPSFGGMLDWVRSDQEITPPLFTAVAWLSVQIGEPTTLIRLPSLLAGIATIPLIYVIALRTLGPRVALSAALLATLSPFLAFYAVEARAYALAVALVAGSTLAMLVALERDRSRGWWIAYAALSCAAMYTHYTSAYVLAAQFAWILLLRPHARIPATIANAAAAAAFLPWLPGIVEDFGSPAQENIGLLVPFTLDSFGDFTASFALGHPARGLNAFYGTTVEIALLLGLAVAAVGCVVSLSRRRDPTGDAEAAARRGAPSRRESVLLFAGLALAAPIGIALVSMIGDDMYVPRNLATSAPAVLIVLAALIDAGPFAFRATALALVAGAFAYGAVETLQPHWQRPEVREAAEFVEGRIAADDVVIDVASFGGTGSSGEPLPTALTLDVNLERPPLEAFSPGDVEAAAASAAGNRLWVVGVPTLVEGVDGALGQAEEVAELARSYDGLLQTDVRVFSIPASATAGARP